MHMEQSRRRFFGWLLCGAAAGAVSSLLAMIGRTASLPQQKLPRENPQRDSVEVRLKKIIVEQLGVKPKRVTPTAHFVKDLGADSLDFVELIMAFEEAFHIEIPDEDAVKILTVGDAISYISSHSKVPKELDRKVPSKKRT